MNQNPFIERIEHNSEAQFLINWTIRGLGLLVTLPIFILLHRNIPNPHWPNHLDRVLLAMLSFLLIVGLFHLMKKLVLVAFITALAWLTIGQFTGTYCFDHLFEDYRAMLYSLKDTPNPNKFIIENFTPFPNKSTIKAAIDFQNPDVRNFALLATAKNFKDYQSSRNYRTLVQCFAIFKEINSNWNYVSDPKSREYYAKASESINHLSGDCDDHSILMAACIKAVGGTPRLILTTGHIYPELLIGSMNDLEALNYLIREQLFRYETGNEGLHYHIDEQERIWLNLDYTARYPGGRFLKEEILGVLKLE